MAKQKKGMTLRRRELVWGLLFISPWLVGIVFFFFLNLIQSVIFSFSNINLGDIGYDLEWVGLGHYVYLFTEDGQFSRILFDSVVMMLVNVPLIIFFSLFMAILLNRAFLGRGLVRAIFFLPVIMATAAIEAPLEFIMAMMQGGVSSLPPEASASNFDAQAVAFMLFQFGMPIQIIDYILEAIAMLHDVIRASGVQIVIFLAALQAIPPSMYEVAQIEGATSYEAFWKITIPMVSPLILTNVVYTMVDTFATSRVVSISAGAMGDLSRMGESAAMALIASLLACLALLIVGWIVSKFVFYYN
jgi:ABC-type sugar transport system permease subunit